MMSRLLSRVTINHGTPRALFLCRTVPGRSQAVDKNHRPIHKPGQYSYMYRYIYIYLPQYDNRCVDQIKGESPYVTPNTCTTQIFFQF